MPETICVKSGSVDDEEILGSSSIKDWVAYYPRMEGAEEKGGFGGSGEGETWRII